jgi:uncharacterized protein
MKKIGLLSDTHGYLPPEVFHHFAAVDEIWHSGDIGSVEVADTLENFKPFRAVFGNVDGHELRIRYPQDLRFDCESVSVWMTHIGGYPPKYTPLVKTLIVQNPPQLFISGHSHILKVIPDNHLHLLHINPGACGKQGWHKIKTLVRFDLESGQIRNLQVIELAK